jgi:hypothetical protein
MDLPVFDACVSIPESIIFVAYRDNLNFIKEPPEILPFTDIERLIMGSDYFDMKYLKDSDYRKANTKFCPHIVPPVVHGIFTQQFNNIFK